jgi:hypothetical protein
MERELREALECIRSLELDNKRLRSELLAEGDETPPYQEF